jgi:Tfp pilus assembly protein FimT
MKTKTGQGGLRRGARAFTIAELLVGIIIIAICFGIVMLALNSGTHHEKP